MVSNNMVINNKSSQTNFEYVLQIICKHVIYTLQAEITHFLM